MATRLVPALVSTLLILAACTSTDKREPSSAGAPAKASSEQHAAQAAAHAPDSAAPRHARPPDTTTIDRSDSTGVSDVEFMTYRGPWFDVAYPKPFRRVACSDSDGVLFASPDGAVKFYVFSPIWNGTSEYARMIEGSEHETARTNETKGSIQLRRFTFTALHGSGIRAFEDVEDTLLNTRRIFGITYRDQAALQRYRTSYLRFKRSLVQYAD